MTYILKTLVIKLCLSQVVYIFKDTTEAGVKRWDDGLCRQGWIELVEVCNRPSAVRIVVSLRQ